MTHLGLLPDFRILTPKDQKWEFLLKKYKLFSNLLFIVSFFSDSFIHVYKVI